MEPGDLTGQVLDDRYRVIEQIAEGAMGVVYRAERIRLGRIVAIKVLHDQLPAELSSRKRFEIEAVAMAKLEHPHCAAVLDVGVHGDKPYVVMDFVSGENLKDVIAQGPMPATRAVEIVRQVLSGLAHAHEHKIIHRDIKPANIVLSQKAGLGDHVKILDFGLARLSADSSGLTAGIVVGTPSYMAPEQIRGAAIDQRTDIYACGVLMFELLTGQKPFVSPKDDPIEVCTMHLKKAPPKLRDIKADLEFRELEAVVAKALAKAPDDRYANAEEFAAALEVVPRRRTLTPIAGVQTLAAAGVKGTGEIPVLPARRPTSELFPGAVRGVRMATPMAGIPVARQRATNATPGVPIPAVATAAGLNQDFDLSKFIPSKDGDADATSILDRSAPVNNASEAGATGEYQPQSVTPSMFLESPPVADDQPAAAPPLAEPSSALPVASRRPRWLVPVLASGGVLVVAVIAIAAGSGGKAAPARGSTASGSAAVVAAPVRPRSGPANDQLVRARKLVSQGRPDSALGVLLEARKQHPSDARLAFEAGSLYFGKRWWKAGLVQLRDAIRLDPTYRDDRELVAFVVDAFVTAPAYHEGIAALIHDELASAAKPILENLASTHPSPGVRSRAATALERL